MAWQPGCGLTQKHCQNPCWKLRGNRFLRISYALSRQGIQQVVLCVGHLLSKLKSLLEMVPFGLQVAYSKEEGPLLGTGGAFEKHCPYWAKNFVLYGDSWLELIILPYSKHSRIALPALMTVFRNEGHWDTSNVELQAGKIQLYSKAQRNERMSHIDYGLGILTRALLEAYPEQQTFDLAEVYERLSVEHRLAVMRQPAVYEIGSPSGLEELNLKLRDEV